MAIDWKDPYDQVTDHFTVADCIYLHNWHRLALPVDEPNFDKLIILCNKLEEVRLILNCPMNISSMFRSKLYNASQNIRPNLDVHALCEAADFNCHGQLPIQQIKDKLLPHLEELGIRMERGTGSWVHLDLHHVGPSGRYFKA